MRHQIIHYVRGFSRWVMGIFPSSHYALLSLFFFTGLEIIFALHRWIPVLLGALLLLLLIGIFLVRAEEKGRFHPTQTILPALAALGLTGFALFLPTVAFLHLYFIASAVMFFYVLRFGAKQAYPTWNWAISLIILFLNLAIILGWRFHLYIPIIFVIVLVFLIFFLISLQSLQRLTPSTSEAFLLSLSTALALTEVTWVLQFLPLYYLIQTAVLVAIYYVLFHLITVSYERRISRQDVVEYMVIGGAALLLVLASAQWI